MKQLKASFSLLMLLLTCCLSAVSNQVRGQAIEVNDATYSISSAVYQNVAKLVPGKELSFDEVRRNNNFKPIFRKKFSVPNFGFKANSIWLKFSVKSNAVDQKDFVFCVENPNLSIANLYSVDQYGNTDSQKSGNIYPFNNRVIQTPDFAFHLHLEPGSQHTYFLQLRSRYPLFTPLSINKPAAQFNQSAFSNSVSTAYLGIVLVMLLYNLFIAFSTKDTTYWLYVTYLLFLGLAQLSISGYAYMFFWPNSPEFNRNSITIFSILGGASALIFSAFYLKLRKFKIKWAIVLTIALLAGFFMSFILFVSGIEKYSFQLMQLTTLLGSLAYLIISLIQLKKDNNAKYFFIGWLLLLLCSVIFILKDYNVFPSNKLTEHIVQLGSIIQIVLLSFGLANQINHLRKQRDAARIAEIEMARKNEKLIRDQNILLNKKVKKRTLELVTANKTLNQTLEDLKHTQSKLVATEKMSSLGQLTAGIAHEINNPINFVSGNVNPLKRDIAQLFEAIDTIENIGMQEKAPAEKMEEIAAYKEETELDYVRSEINTLINGIADGASRTANIVKGLRVFSRLDEDTWKPADINEGLRSTLAITANMMKGVSLETQFGDLPPVTCYPGKLNQVFLNIITNAVYAIQKQFGNDVGGKLSVTTAFEEPYVFVSIKDDGIGMDEETKAKLFDPFFTTKPIGEGTGLGMSIVFSILEKHHASCEILSQPGKGTEFKLRFHIQPPEDKPKPIKESIAIGKTDNEEVNTY